MHIAADQRATHGIGFKHGASVANEDEEARSTDLCGETVEDDKKIIMGTYV